jgi:hypothetical protein
VLWKAAWISALLSLEPVALESVRYDVARRVCATCALGKALKPAPKARSDARPLAYFCSRVKDRERFPPATVRVASPNLRLNAVTAIFSGAKLRYESSALKPLG